MGVGTGLMKTLMFVFNGIVWVLGLVLFVVGIVVLVEGKNWNEIVDNKTVPVSVMLIVVGLIIAVVGFLGCFGAMKQSGNMLLAYSVILGLIIILQCVAGILAFIFSDESEEMIEDSLSSFIKDYTGSDDVNTDHLFNVIMEEFECCGINGYTDWNTETNKLKWTQSNVPDSCCVEMDDTCGWDYFVEDGAQKVEINKEGCLAKTVTAVKDNMKLVYICALAFVVVEFIQIIFSCVLRKDAKGVLA
ncbi:CD151 antigen-like isoform X2 [Bolinopsis microptera]|uniref:CD151 antigen-like isoform X2 n=1 Tax=Bolinopsis microptera TaxID=2820187 RepID=UPI0030790E26